MNGRDEFEAVINTLWRFRSDSDVGMVNIYMMEGDRRDILSFEVLEAFGRKLDQFKKQQI
jgi:hypothetical protein